MAEERLLAEERGLVSMTVSEILQGDYNRGPAPRTCSPSLYDKAHTVYERHSQCTSVLSEISPTLCNVSFLGMLQSNVMVAFSSTKGSSDFTIHKLAQNWGIGLEAAK